MDVDIIEGLFLNFNKLTSTPQASLCRRPRLFDPVVS